MRQMPSIPVKINYDLADAIINNVNLHRCTMSQQQATTKMSTQSFMAFGGTHDSQFVHQR